MPVYFNRFAQPWEERDVDPLDEYMSSSSCSSEDDVCDSSEKSAVKTVPRGDVHKTRSCIELRHDDAAGKDLSKHCSAGAMLKHCVHSIETDAPTTSAPISINKSTATKGWRGHASNDMIKPEEAQSERILEAQRRECRRSNVHGKWRRVGWQTYVYECRIAHISFLVWT